MWMYEAEGSSSMVVGMISVWMERKREKVKGKEVRENIVRVGKWRGDYIIYISIYKYI